jgi:hypothetical protein
MHGMLHIKRALTFHMNVMTLPMICDFPEFLASAQAQFLVLVLISIFAGSIPSLTTAI